jgi:hypothetical protein
MSCFETTPERERELVLRRLDVRGGLLRRCFGRSQFLIDIRRIERREHVLCFHGVADVVRERPHVAGRARIDHRVLHRLDGAGQGDLTAGRLLRRQLDRDVRELAGLALAITLALGRSAQSRHDADEH